MRLIVVGSGVVGASCAFAASRLGAEVVLVDAALPGQATAAGAGIVCPWWSSSAVDPVWYEFACASARRYPALIAELGELGETSVGYRQVGALILAGAPERLEEARRTVLARRAGAPEVGEVAVLTGAEARDLFPPLREDHAAVFIGGGSRVDGRLLAGALARAAVGRGAVVSAGRAELACRGGRAARVMLDGQLIGADGVVAAAGAWTSSFTEPAGVAVPVTPQRGQIAHIGVEPEDTSRWPVVLPGETGHYLLAFFQQHLAIAAMRAFLVRVFRLLHDFPFSPQRALIRYRSPLVS